MNDLYFHKLKEIILPAPNHRQYGLLINKLYSEEFTPIVDRDKNRATDGIFLRSFLGYTNNGPCSVLEMMIALAGRFDGNAGFDPEEAYLNFWTMMENIGLDYYDDSRYSEREVWGILHILQNRTYDFNGHGGLFPLKKAKNDQRKEELWNQLQAWEIENYGV